MTEQNSARQPPAELGDDSSPTAVIRTVARLQRLPGLGSIYPVWLDRTKGASTTLISASAILFLILGGVALAYGKPPLPKVVTDTALPLGVLAECFALLALVLQTIQGLIELWIDHRRTTLETVLACERDMDHAQRLSKSSGRSLNAAQTWIEHQRARIDSRLGLVFGGSEKIALFALVGVAWTIWKELPKEWLSLWGFPIICGLAFFTGAALGGLVLRQQLRRLSYQRDLIALAKTLKDSTTP